ncbi:MAG: capsular polysaccharide biosynthesis protein [Firmicutes bacterium]|nr:capsular polysaccharide biosynthesis protein [Bacillota bacterium]
MIDFHTHILPGIDDGSRDMDMTIRMLEAERDQGVSHICATPHFYAHRRSVDFFLERRNRALKEVRKVLTDRSDLPQITPGAEVLYFRGMEQAELLPELCLEGTDILLLEMPFDQWTGEMAKAIGTILTKRGLKVVLAHVERYLRFQKDKTVWDQILNMPLTLQMNAESFIHAGSFLRQNKEHKLCLQLLEERGNCILGTDCHNMDERKPNLEEARAVIEKKIGAKRLEEIDKYTAILFRVNE